VNYIAFHGEFFEEEYEQNHRPISSELSYAMPSVTWETFDKSNAPKAFVMSVDVTIELLAFFKEPRIRITPIVFQFDIIRDKSPPVPFSHII